MNGPNPFNWVNFAIAMVPWAFAGMLLALIWRHIGVAP